MHEGINIERVNADIKMIDEIVIKITLLPILSTVNPKRGLKAAEI